MITNRCGCALIKLVTGRIKVNNGGLRSRGSFSRTPTRTYLPARGELSAKQSLAKLPPSTKKDEAKRMEATIEIQRFAEAGEIFRKVMGDIHTSKNKRQIALEGTRLVEEGLRYGLKLRTLFLLKSLKELPDCVKGFVDNEKDEKGYRNYDDKKEPEVIRVKLSTLELWSSVKTPPGIIGIFDKPTESHKSENNLLKLNANSAPVPLTVILDNVREPGNLGSIIRTAAGIGCNVLLSSGCADAWEMKALRGGDGAQFYVPMASGVNLEALYRYPQLSEHFTNNNPSSKGIGIFLADSYHLGADNFGLPIQPYTSFNYGDFSQTILILGGETTGLSDSVRKAVANLQKFYPENVKTVSRVTIPMCMPIDSLNVANAFGIIGYEIARQYKAK